MTTLKSFLFSNINLIYKLIKNVKIVKKYDILRFVKYKLLCYYRHTEKAQNG